MNEPDFVETTDRLTIRTGDGRFSGLWRIGRAEFDERSGCLTVGDHAHELDHSGHQLLSHLLRNAGEIVAKELLLKVGWPGRVATESSLTKAIHRLRQALCDPEGNLLCTVHGYGYRLAARVEYVPASELLPSADTLAVEAQASQSPTAPGFRRLASWIGLTITAIIIFVAGNLTNQPLTSQRLSQVPLAFPSIAVLPFRDLSRAHNQSYMAEGIAEELQNRLTQARALRVIGRTTSFAFQGQNFDVQAIGKSLRVSHVLEGSVRSSGDRIRITVHLVRTADAVEVWSQTYDRTLSDVLALQDEISSAVATQLRVRQLGSSTKRHQPIPRAYTLVQKSRQLERLGISGIDSYGPLIREAVAIDPEYSDAWYILGILYLDEINAGRRPRKSGLKLVRSAYEKSLSLDPENAVVYALLGNFSYFYEHNPVRGAQYFEHALSIEPGNLKVLFMGAALANALGRTDDAIRAVEYVVDRDPVSAQTQAVLGYYYYRSRRWDDAISRFRTAIAISPDVNLVNSAIGDALRQKGQPAAALAWYEREKDERYRLYGLTIANHALGRETESKTSLNALQGKYGAVRDDGEAYWLIARALAQRGEFDQAFAWLEKASDPGTYDLESEIELSRLHSDSRWLPFLRENGRAPEQVEALHRVKFDLNVPAEKGSVNIFN